MLHNMLQEMIKISIFFSLQANMRVVYVTFTTCFQQIKSKLNRSGTNSKKITVQFFITLRHIEGGWASLLAQMETQRFSQSWQLSFAQILPLGLNIFNTQPSLYYKFYKIGRKYSFCLIYWNF